MTTKLTLSIDENVIRTAKLHSQRKGKSLSKIVEEHLRAIEHKEADKKLAVKSLSGILKGTVPATANLEKLKGDYLKSKYDL